MEDRKVLRWALYVAFGIGTFLVATVSTFPTIGCCTASDLPVKESSSEEYGRGTRRGWTNLPDRGQGN